MVIPRDKYLKQLIESMGNGLIKIITGIRRCGKSFLLSEIFNAYLHQHGVPENHIIQISLDDRKYAKLRNPDTILEYIDAKINDAEMYYVFIDEIQMLEEFVDVLNSLLHIRNVDVYVTGSNSRFLSKDIATEFRGRGDEIHLYPLSFSEFHAALGGNIQSIWKEFYSYGGIPQILVLNSDEKKEAFLRSLYISTYLNDIFDRHNIKNRKEFEELTCIMASSIGAPSNPTKLANTFKSLKGVNLDKSTISRYLDYLEDAFILKRALRYDVKGKKYISTLSKYYFQDMGIRNAVLDFRQMEESHIMENVIYNELLIRGYRVDVGVVEHRTTNKDNQTIRKQYEVDFVANHGDDRVYVQSVLQMTTFEKKEQETASYKRISDSFKKVIVVKDDIKPYYDDNGYYIIGLFDFLLDADSLKR